MKTIVIDLLYLDLTTCERCMGTGKLVEEVVKDLELLLSPSHYSFQLRKIKMDSVDLAMRYHFLSSPTIRVNGIDVLGEIKENVCVTCGEVCGDETLCRVFMYNGKAYNEPPRGMLVEGILKAIFNDHKSSDQQRYDMPGNIMNFIHKTSK